MTPTPDPAFVRELHAYDPLLRCRWGQHRGYWQIERKVPSRQPDYLLERPAEFNRTPAARDAWDAWKDAHIIVLSIHPARLHWTLVAPHLRRLDFQAQGGIAALNRRLDDEEADRQRGVDRAVDHFAETGAKELYDRLAWDDGRSVSLHNPDPLARLEVREGYRVLDRRRI